MYSFVTMKLTINAIIGLMILAAIFGCTKPKIKDSCENNVLEISPTDYNTDSAVIYIPSAFTPNGDGLNDLFRPFIGGLKLSKFEVCKGNKVLYRADDIEEWGVWDKKGWDGTDENGKQCKDGVYTYEIAGSNPTDGDFKICGEVSLITKEENKSCLCRYEDMLDPTRGFIRTSGDNCNNE